MRINSLAFRLIASAAGWSVVVLVVTGLILSSLFQNAVQRNFDLRLQAYLKGLIANTELGEHGRLVQPRALGETRFDIPFSGWYWQITELDTDDPDLLASRSLFDFRLPLPHNRAIRPDRQSLRRAYVPGPEDQRLRIIEREIRLVGSEQAYSFAVAGDGAEITAEVAAFNNILFIAMSLLAFGLVAAAIVQVRFGLQPLRRLQRALSRIREGKQERLGGEYPVEIEPVAKELNALLRANQDVVERARTHVGNLAHALKTPLSVISNEARSHRGALARKVMEQTGLMSDQINLYLDRARMAAGARVLGAVTGVEPVTRRLVRAVRRIYSDKRLEITTEIDKQIRFRGESQDLEEMMGNLIDNACKWASKHVRIAAGPHDPGESGHSMMEIVVDDDGPGLPAGRRKEVLKRGRRLDESKPGAGLGLAIASELAGAYGGRIELKASPLKGLQARLLLPRV